MNRRKPRLPLPSTNVSGGNITSKELKKRIFDFFSRYIDMFQSKVLERNLILGDFSFSKPTDYYFFLDTRSLHCIYTSQYAGNITGILYNDFRHSSKPQYEEQELARWLQAQKGITQWKAISFDLSLLESSNTASSEILDRTAEEQVTGEQVEFIRTHQPLFISLDELELFLAKAGEDDFTNILLVPLLRHIGFINAEAKGHRDRTLEYGQDIRRMKLQIPTGHWLYFSAQVKTGDIHTKNTEHERHVSLIIQQTMTQLNWEMPDPEIGRNVKPDHVLLITSGFISEAAKQYIFRHELTQNRRLLLLEKETLIRLCDKEGLPESVQNTILDFNKSDN